MRGHMVALGLAAISAAGPVAAQSAPTPDAAVAAAFTPGGAGSSRFAYDFVSETFGEEPGIVRGRFDPSQPKGQRYTILEVTAKDQTIKKVDERYEKRGTGGGGSIWCDEAFGGADGPVTPSADAAGFTVYEFRPLPPKSGQMADAEDMYKAMKASVTVEPNTNQIRAYQAQLTKPITMMVVATVRAAKFSGQCAAAPNGRMYSMRTEMEFSASGMGQKMQRRFVQTISNLTPVN